VLLALTVAAGIGLGGEYGVGQALVSEVMPFRRRGWWSGMLYAGASIGSIAAVLIGAYVLPHIGWRWVFGLSSFPILVVLYVRAKSPESDVWESRRDQTRTNWRLLYQPGFIWPFFLCLLAASMEFFAYYGTAAFLPTYFIKVVGFSFSKTALFTILIFIAILIGCTVGSYTSDRWGRRITWTCLSAIAAIGGLVLGLSWNNVKSDIILIPFFIFYFGTGVAAMFGSVFSEQFPTEIRSFGVSASLQIGRGISYFPPLIAAAIYPVHGYRVLIFGGAVLYAVLAALAWVFKEGRNKSVHQLDDSDQVVTSGEPAVGGQAVDGYRA
jgi:MFS family permease